MSQSVLIPSTPTKNNRDKSNKLTKRTKWVPLNEFINDDKIEDNQPSSSPPARNHYYQSRKTYREQRIKKNYKSQSAGKSPLKTKNIKYNGNVATQTIDNQIGIPDYFYESPEDILASPMFPFSPPTMIPSKAYATNYFDSYFQLPYASLSFQSPPSGGMKAASKTSDGNSEKTKISKPKSVKKVVSDANIKYSSMEFLNSAAYHQEFHFNPNFIFESPISPMISPISPMAAITPLALNLSPPGVTPPTSAPRLNRFQRIKIQLEYYFSISNLCKDMYLRRLIGHSSGGIKLDELIRFKRLKILNCNVDLLILVIRKNQDLNLELINDDTEVRIENWKQWVV